MKAGGVGIGNGTPEADTATKPVVRNTVTQAIDFKCLPGKSINCKEESKYHVNIAAKKIFDSYECKSTPIYDSDFLRITFISI